MSEFHVPVMAQESIRFLNLKAGAIIVDATTGGGGHSLLMLQAEPQIKLYCFDQDDRALIQARQTLKDYSQVEYLQTNFSRLRTELALRKIKGIDGILFDLGVSSHQLDAAERGFSFDRNAPLDMRMNQADPYSAYNAVNELGERELTEIFREFGEEPSARKIARLIASAEKPIRTTGELAALIEKAVGSGTKESLKTKVRVFQALRIHVNRELSVLESALTDAINLLNPGGRIVVISYHSLEDRIVKQTFRLAEQDCICPPAALKCVCNHKKQLKLLTRKPIVASEAEVADNSRSRSAKLRAGEKVGREQDLGFRKKVRQQKLGEK